MFSFVILADILKCCMLQRKTNFFVNLEHTVKLDQECRTLRKNQIHKTANKKIKINKN